MSQLNQMISKQLQSNAETYAALMVDNANRIGLNVISVNATAADGNCFYHALVDQFIEKTY